MLARKRLTTITLTLLAAPNTLAAPAPAIPTIATLDIDPVPNLPALPLDKKRWTLSFKGDAACRVASTNSMFCREGDTVVSGSNVFAQTGGVSSSCRDVALGAQRIIDSCTTPQGAVTGNSAANGNGELIVAISRV
ncbi:hypothetical protein BJX68DRAFT_269326 [Aspergillus pseudodeflectus]|uniref:Uncharacterized protein n=1 Tax=Aspergillus pseudodeflectus TaxID=176178 RepID=A0ABR4JYK4_9EURO